jgi:hypothetical protein
MKLPNFIDSESFNLLRRKINAPLSFYKLKISLPLPKIRELKPVAPPPVVLPAQGLDVSVGEITVHSDGTLLYKGRRVLIHIRDVTNIGGGRKHEPKFHVSNCRTLVEMKSSGRFERYVAADGEDGNFHIRYDTGPLKPTKLDVCQNCLDFLSWDGFSSEMSRSSRQSIVSSFSIKRFFDQYPKSLHPHIPTHTASTAPINDYPLNWDEISSELKRQLRFRCQGENCGVEVGLENKRFLHVHHKNGLKYDCRAENLLCLCIRCHAGQPHHNHIKELPEYTDFISRFIDSKT